MQGDKIYVFAGDCGVYIYGDCSEIASRRLLRLVHSLRGDIPSLSARVDHHRGGLGRVATDAHLAASLSVAVRRLAVSEPAPVRPPRGGQTSQRANE